ncbi:hypothetical protein AB0C87_24880 [Actinomadura sp. NPDC048021]|uniref:hypothetical protein n=1 Tax=Actinomadura sp. NPDC048021 TaxID=3155385 RepID=UPI0033C203AD
MTGTVDLPEWKQQARVIADVLKEHAETAADFAETLSYEMEGVTDTPEMLDLDSIQKALDNTMAHAERAKIQLAILRVTLPGNKSTN